MIDDPALRETVTAAGHLMAATREPWWIIGSAAVALHLARPAAVTDVDVLLDLDDAQRLLPMIGLAPVAGTAHPDFRSAVFGRWLGSALPVEFMAGFRHRTADGWRLVRPDTRQCILIDSTTVYVPGKAELHDLLVAFGRPKDVKRAQQLAAVM
ncbi:MAG TPA: hypothetical protein DEP91_02395 [Sphingomonas bacterium]|jgi:hypothetical protein|uniref:Nucleotidyltransferase family protein n=1 Tax=Sphingomonas bacterium TaxID=1895847 RepID=A0A3D0WAJ6_9SPHN|nr:hypothetical protein [Sphingomonas bacterium]